MSEAERIAYSIRAFQYPQDYPAVMALWESAGPGVHFRRSDSASEIEKKLQQWRFG